MTFFHYQVVRPPKQVFQIILCVLVCPFYNLWIEVKTLLNIIECVWDTVNKIHQYQLGFLEPTILDVQMIPHARILFWEYLVGALLLHADLLYSPDASGETWTPTSHNAQRILSPMRLPIPPHSQKGLGLIFTQKIFWTFLEFKGQFSIHPSHYRWEDGNDSTHWTLSSSPCMSSCSCSLPWVSSTSQRITFP